jgi:hypothetical protein
MNNLMALTSLTTEETVRALDRGIQGLRTMATRLETECRDLLKVKWPAMRQLSCEGVYSMYCSTKRKGSNP